MTAAARRLILVVTVVALLPIAAARAGGGPGANSGESGRPAPARSVRPAGADPRVLLPGDGEFPGWTRAEEPRVFDGKTLFGHIDGGAEEFLAHGFRALGVGGYRQDSLEIVAEIYDMGYLKGAKAILDARDGGKGDDSDTGLAGTDSLANTPSAAPAAHAPIGDDGVVDSMQVQFRRGRYYVSVTGFEKRPEVAGALRALADTIDARIRSAGRVPAGR